MKRLILVLAILLLLPAISAASSFEDGIQAWEAGKDKKAFEIFKLLANEGHANAQFQLGNRYFVRKNCKEAIKWYQKAADQGYGDAQFELGRIYHPITNQERIILESMEISSRESELGGRLFTEELKAELRELRESEPPLGPLVVTHALETEHHSINHSFQLFIYKIPCDISRNIRTAINWYRQAAEKGHANSSLILGDIYYIGFEVTRDYKEAMRWYRIAANDGNHDAELMIAKMYGKGRGVPKDEIEQARWLGKAVGGQPGSEIHFWGQILEGRLEYKRAVKFYQEAAEMGHCTAQRDLGILYAQGLGVPQDYILAHKWSNLGASCSPGFSFNESAKNRRNVERKMTPSQIVEAQKLAHEWKSQPAK